MGQNSQLQLVVPSTLMASKKPKVFHLAKYPDQSTALALGGLPQTKSQVHCRPRLPRLHHGAAAFQTVHRGDLICNSKAHLSLQECAARKNDQECDGYILSESRLAQCQPNGCLKPCP